MVEYKPPYFVFITYTVLQQPYFSGYHNQPINQQHLLLLTFPFPQITLDAELPL